MTTFKRKLKRISRLFFTSGLTLLMLGGSGASASGLTGNITADDPTLIESNGCFYAFSTGHPPVKEGTITIRRSCGSLSGPWRVIGTVFDAQPKWIAEAIGTRPEHLWAPDISYHRGKFYLYYTGSTFGSNISVIGLATNTTLDPDDPEYEWVDEGMVVRSYRYNNYNAIDPEVFWGDHEAWLAFGSWWDGIKMRRLDPRPASPSKATPRYTPSLPGEAPESRRRRSCTGTATTTSSSPTTAAARGERALTTSGSAAHRPITGPYVDREGRPMLAGGGTLLMGRGDYPRIGGGSFHVRGAGGQDAFFDGETWKLVYHWYTNSGAHRMAISDLSWSPDGWPVMGPIR